jgi:hypothetical protein
VYVPGYTLEVTRQDSWLVVIPTVFDMGSLKISQLVAIASWEP